VHCALLKKSLLGSSCRGWSHETRALCYCVEGALKEIPMEVLLFM